MKLVPYAYGCIQPLLEANHSVPYRAAPLRTMVPFVSVQVLFFSFRLPFEAYLGVPVWYALHPTPRYDTLHTNGAQCGFTFKCPSRYHTVHFSMLRTTWGSGPHAFVPVVHGYNLFSKDVFKHPSGTVWYGYGTLKESAWMRTFVACYVQAYSTGHK